MPANARVREPAGDRIRKNAYSKTPEALSFGPSAKHKQAINISLVAFGYDLQGRVTADRQQLEHSCGGSHPGLALTLSFPQVSLLARDYLQQGILGSAARCLDEAWSGCNT